MLRLALLLLLSLAASAQAAEKPVISFAMPYADGAPRMPPDFALPEADIELIEQWITNGANDD